MKLKFIRVDVRHLRRLNEIVNNCDVSRFLTLVPPVSMKSTRAWYRQCKRARNLWWVIIHDGDVIGSVNLMRKSASPKLRHVVEMGLALDRRYWGMGFGQKAITFAVRQARIAGFKRLELIVVADNLRAYRLYRSCGFRREGAMTKYMRIGRKYCDAIMMSMCLG